MRITIVNTLYPPSNVGGAEKSVALLAEALMRAGDRVSVITLHPEAEELVEVRNGVKVYRLPLDNFFWPFGVQEKPTKLARLCWHLRDIWNPTAARRVGRILDIEKPDVVHSNNIAGFSPTIFSQVKKRRIRLVHTLRDYYMLCSRYTTFRDGKTCQQRCFECKILTAGRRRASHQADAVVSNSSYVLRKHQHFGFFEGVPASVCFNVAATRLAIQESLPNLEQSLRFGFIGRVEPEKGIEVVLAATLMLTRDNWKLRIAGRGIQSYVENLQAVYPDPRIEWLGFANSESFYASIDVTLIASIWPEPLPRTLIDAFAAGKAAICSDAGGIPEMSSMGTTVAVYPATEVAALAQLMNAALEEPEKWRHGGFADSTSRQAFSEEAVVSTYRAVYDASR